MMSYERFMIIERLGINQDVELLSNFLKSKISNRSLTITNIPLKLSKPINKIVIYIKNPKDINAAFDIGKSGLTKNGYNLYFIFPSNPSIDLISHEVNHAYQFMMKGREKSIQSLHRLRSARLASGLLPFGGKNSKLNEVVDLIYYLSDSEIDSFTTEIYTDIKELSKRYKIDKKSFVSLVSESEPYKICKFIDPIKLSDYLSDVSIDDKIKFFSVLKEEESRLKGINIKNDLFRKLTDLYHFIKTYVLNIDPVKKIELDNLNLTIDKWDKYLKIKSDKLKKKLFRLYDLLD